MAGHAGTSTSNDEDIAPSSKIHSPNMFWPEIKGMLLENGRETAKDLQIDCGICLNPIVIAKDGTHNDLGESGNITLSATERSFERDPDTCQGAAIMPCGHVLGERCLAHLVGLRSQAAMEMAQVGCPLCNDPNKHRKCGHNASYFPMTADKKLSEYPLTKPEGGTVGRVCPGCWFGMADPSIPNRLCHVLSERSLEALHEQFHLLLVTEWNTVSRLYLGVTQEEPLARATQYLFRNRIGDNDDHDDGTMRIIWKRGVLEPGPICQIHELDAGVKVHSVHRSTWEPMIVRIRIGAVEPLGGAALDNLMQELQQFWSVRGRYFDEKMQFKFGNAMITYKTGDDRVPEELGPDEAWANLIRCKRSRPVPNDSDDNDD